MIRRLSASIFLFGMVLLVLLKQPAFAYCGHTHRFFISDCGCEEKASEVICPNCQKETPQKPCDDCSERISLNVDDLTWSDLVVVPPVFTSCEVVNGESEVVAFQVTESYRVAPIRPPPPLVATRLFLLNSVFRL